MRLLLLADAGNRHEAQNGQHGGMAGQVAKTGDRAADHHIGKRRGADDGLVIGQCDHADPGIGHPIG